MHTLQKTLVHDDIKKVIVEEIKGQIREAKKVLNGPFKQEYSDIVRAVNQKRAEYYVLVQLIKHYEKLNSNGQIEDKHADMIIKELHKKKAILLRTIPEIKQLDIVQLLESSELADIFGKDMIDKLSCAGAFSKTD